MILQQNHKEKNMQNQKLFKKKRLAACFGYNLRHVPAGGARLNVPRRESGRVDVGRLVEHLLAIK